MFQFSALKNSLSKSEFTKNSVTLVIGSVLAQTLPIALSPIISRLYTPDNIAVWGLYMSITTILLSTANGGYELSIMLPQKEEDAINLFSLTILITFLTCCIFLLIALFFNNHISILLHNESIAIWLIFVPLSVFILSLTNSLTHWFNRKGNYKIIAMNKVNKNWGITIAQFLFGSTNHKPIGLISGQIIGELASAVLLGINFIKGKYFSLLESNFSIQKIKKLASEHKKFPLFTMPTVLLNNISSEVLTILVAIWFSNGLTGAYYFSVRLLSAPMALIGSSVSQVFFRKFSTIINEGTQDAKKFILKIWLGLIAIAVLPLTILYVWGEYLFVFVFGQEWGNAGKIASIMAPMILFTFASSPTGIGLVVLRKQNHNLLFGIFVFLYRPFSFYLGYKFNDFFLGLKILVAFEILNVLVYNAIMWNHIDKLKTI
jgi:O-antigen/teichoic acid export membrane protein